MVIRWKDSCKFDNMHAALWLALHRAEAIYEKRFVECWVTSVNDSTHMVGSKHFDGRAFDLRVHNLPDEPTRVAVFNELRAALGPQFTVLYEHAGLMNAHIHVQFNGK